MASLLTLRFDQALQAGTWQFRRSPNVLSVGDQVQREDGPYRVVSVADGQVVLAPDA